MADNKFDIPQDQPLFMAISKSDPELLAAMKAANKSLPSFRKLIQSVASPDNIPMVKSHFTDGKGLWLWLIVREAKDNGFIAETFEAPSELPALKTGTRRWIPDSEVADWMIEQSGVLHGGYSLRLQRSRLPEVERASFDRYIGAKSYATLPR